MKKKLLFWAGALIVIIVIIVLLNIKVSTRQGINFNVHTIKIPLYLKTLDFFDRHYNYKWTVQRIIGDSKTEEEKALKIFAWTYENIRKAPEGSPVIDDHVWHIIIRGYGVNDQSCDVFATLCNYAGLGAFFANAYNTDKTSAIPLSFVNIRGVWSVLDPFNGAYFVNHSGIAASVEQINRGDWVKMSLSGANSEELDYKEYFDGLSEIKCAGLSRANIQSPLKRFIYQVKKIFP
ncbi:MAG: transglutaminase domain-containing protein [Candidatus Omnitrophica bacterium]|nr:transglutaminase domain-containing protein [Candidatus Omnitrophota bacterium]